MSAESGFDAMIKRIKEEDLEILKALGSDFDEEGIPYWKKWGNVKGPSKDGPLNKTD